MEIHTKFAILNFLQKSDPGQNTDQGDFISRFLGKSLINKNFQTFITPESVMILKWNLDH